MHKGHIASSNVDSLSAFWAGLQVLAGDVQGAIKSHLFCEFAASDPGKVLCSFVYRLEFMEKVWSTTRAL